MKKKSVIHVMDVNCKDRTRTSDILNYAYSCWERGEVNAARVLFDRAATTCHGMIEYARFLLSGPALDDMSMHECTKKAGQLLGYVARNGNAQEMGEACKLLADLCKSTNVILSVGYLIRANRCGKNDNARLQTQLLKRISEMEVSDVENDLRGCYLAGAECAHFAYDPVMRKWAMWFLEMAVENGQSTVAGLAAMRMADLCDEYIHDRELSIHYKKIAARNGNPEVLTKHTISNTMSALSGVC